MSAMFDNDVAEWAVTDLVEGAIDEAGGSPRRWAVLLLLVLAGRVGMLWFAKRTAADDVLPPPDAGGSG